MHAFSLRTKIYELFLKIARLALNNPILTSRKFAKKNQTTFPMCNKISSLNQIAKYLVRSDKRNFNPIITFMQNLNSMQQQQIDEH